MLSLYKKEIAGFFSSLTGYLVIIIFLLATSLFMWVFPGELNILDAGYSSIEPLFIIAPWIFLFLVPAITMRMFAEERKSGTLELLFSRPVSDFGIVLSKYLASLTLVLFSLIPCMVYYFSVYFLGNPVGNIDAGGTWGSFAGLFFLAALYAAIGIFASGVSENIIVSFVLSLALCFFFLSGIDSIAHIPAFSSISTFILNLGINEHYQSMSRGVIDSRDLIYFLAMVAIFLVVTKTLLNSRKW